MGRTSDAAERLVSAACTLMRARGYAAISVAEICVEAGVQKGSFYHFFESKQTLTVAVIDAHWAAEREHWMAVLNGKGKGYVLPRIERLVMMQARTQRAAKKSGDPIPGCLLGNLALELSSQDIPARARLIEVFAEQEMLLVNALRAAEAEGTVPRGTATPVVARAVLGQIEGMVLFAKVADDPAVLSDLWAGVKRLIGAVEPAPVG